MRTLHATLWIALLAGGTNAAKAETQPWPREPVSEHISEPGETLENFLMRDVGPALNSFTRETGHEGCGVIATDGARFAVRLGSDGVQHGCAIHLADVPTGFTSTREHIHSHPNMPILRLTRRDREWSAHHWSQSPPRELRNDGKAGFSPADYAAGPGWLVVSGRLMHQAGPRAIRNHGFFKD